MNDVELAAAVRSAIALHRQQGRIPTEVLLSQDHWNTLRRQLTFGSYGPRTAVQFDGIPCVLVIGMTSPAGYRVRAIDPPSE